MTAFTEALKEITRERVPLDWAGTQNNLGNVLATLGKRERGTERLEQAVTAFTEALKERTRERVHRSTGPVRRAILAPPLRPWASGSAGQSALSRP